MKKTALNYSWFFLFLFSFIPQTVLSQGTPKITISGSVDSSTITIGDLITYTVKIIHDEDVAVQLPSLGENLGGFEIRDYIDHELRKENDKIVHQVDYIISTFETGEFEIPPISVGYTIPPDTVVKVLKTPSIEIIVESVNPSEDGDIREIKPPWEIPFNWKPVVLISSIILFVILFIFGLIYVIRKRRKGESIIPRKLEPPRPPHEVAYEELQRLADSDYLENGEIKLYYYEVSDIIRRYIESRYQIIAMELTTTGVLDQLKYAEIEEEHFEDFVRFLESCDLVKFAKYIPAKKENEDILELATHIVDMTKWIEPVTDGNEMIIAEENELDDQSQLKNKTDEKFVESTLEAPEEELKND